MAGFLKVRSDTSQQLNQQLTLNLFLFNQGEKEIARISKRDVESWMFEGTKGLS